MSQTRTPSQRNTTLAIACAVFVACMVGAAYASVPLYNLFCKVTGYGGTTQVSDAAPSQILDQTIRVRLDANVMAGLPWRFTPSVPYIDVKIGALATVTYHAENVADVATVGTATFNVTPDQTGSYFNKLDCFCFTRQELAPGEATEMGVTFYVDPAIVEDEDTRNVHTITLSYSFFAVRDGESPLALAPAVATGVLQQ